MPVQWARGASIGAECWRGLSTCDDVTQLLVLVNSCKSKLPEVLRLQKLFGPFPIFWNMIWGERVQLLQHPVKQNQCSLYYLKISPKFIYTKMWSWDELHWRCTVCHVLYTESEAAHLSSTEWETILNCTMLVKNVGMQID